MKDLKEYINESIINEEMDGEERVLWDALELPKIVKVNGVKCYQLSNGTKLVDNTEILHKYANIKTQLDTDVAKFLKDNPGFRLANVTDLSSATTEELLAIDKAEMDPENREHPSSFLIARFCTGDKITSQKYATVVVKTQFMKIKQKPITSDIAARNFARICVVADE